MDGRRIERLNSLLKEVISDVIRDEVKNPHLPDLITVTRVEITADLRQAKVYINVIGNEKTKKDALEALHSAAGFIAIKASEQVVMRFFPVLTFHLDNSLDMQMRIEAVISEIQKERQSREHESNND